jgi:hypothetical protein
MDKAIAKAISVIIVVFGAAPESVEAWHSAGAHALARAGATWQGIFQTSLGFYDLANRPPSMKAVVEAWGAGTISSIRISPRNGRSRRGCRDHVQTQG